MSLAGGDDHRRDRAVKVGFFSAFVFHARTVLAMDFLRGVIPRAVQRDGNGLVNGAIVFQHVFVAQALKDFVVKGKEFLGRDGVQGLADVIVRRDLLDLEKALGVAPPLGLLQGFLMGQERR